MVAIKGFIAKETCIGCRLCADICLGVFSMDDDGKAIATDNEMQDDVLDSAKKKAEMQCPVGVITVK